MNTPYVETDCTFTHDGHTFESGGAYITDERAVVYCRTGEDIPKPQYFRSGRPYFKEPNTLGTDMWRGTLTTWKGDRVGTYHVQNSRRTTYGTTYYISARINGRDYYGQTQGPGMVAFLRAYKHQEG